MLYSEDNLIMISSLQHLLFCERQFALIHLEQIWEENLFTVEGNILHERVDIEHNESRKFFRQEYAMAVRSLESGLIGKCDLVELWTDEQKSVVRANPVEFKRGRKKESAVDRVQLCAQALCLEEMFSIRIESGQLYYLQEHRRTDVVIDKELRDATFSLAEKARCILDEGKTPKAFYEKRKCDNCSLIDACMPEETGADAKNVHLYVTSLLSG